MFELINNLNVPSAYLRKLLAFTNPRLDRSPWVFTVVIEEMNEPELGLPVPDR